MELRPVQSGELEAVRDLISAWDSPREQALALRTLEASAEPGGPDVWVAQDDDAPAACVTLSRRRLRILGHAIPTASISSLFTRPSRRGEGIARRLLERVAEAGRDAKLELSLIFTPDARAFDHAGWIPWRAGRSILRRADGARAPRADAASEIEIEAFERGRGLGSVKAIHSSYSGARHGTVIRDDALWEASLDAFEALGEEFWIARRGGLAVAYLRASVLEEGLTVTEIGRFEDGAAALARLIARLLVPRVEDALAPPGVTSEALRGAALLPTFDDIALTVSLEHEGITAEPIEDARGQVRCLDLPALAARVDVDPLTGEDGPAFLRRILPPDGFVFWPADRF